MKLTDEQKKKLILDYNVRQEKFNNKGELVGSTINLPNLGEAIFNGLNLHFITTIDNSEIHCYNSSFFEINGEQIIKDIVEQLLGNDTTEHGKKEVVGYVRDKNYQKRNIFDSNPNLLNLKNGVIDLKKREFKLHGPDYYFLNELPIEYKPKAKIKKVREFLKQVVDKSDIPLLQEIFGYTLYKDYHIQKAIMFLGGGANGKSTVLSLLKAMLGQNNISGVSLQDLDESRFATAELYNKLANIYPDISDKALHRTGKFKMLTGGDMVSAEQKFKGRFNYVNYAKLIFSCNKLPEVKDDSDAYFRRWIIINFPNKFEGDNCDPKILEKLIKELPELFNWALTGLRRLLKNGEFTNSKGTDDIREEYQRLASPIAAFVMDCLQINYEMYVTKDDLYDAFRQYCEKNSLPLIAKNVFSMRLHEHVRIRDYRATIEGKRVQSWCGIGFSDASGMSGLSGFRHYLISQDAHTGVYKIEKHLDNLDDYNTEDDA